MISDERLNGILSFEGNFPTDEKIILAKEIKRLRAEMEIEEDKKAALRKEVVMLRAAMPSKEILVCSSTKLLSCANTEADDYCSWCWDTTAKWLDLISGLRDEVKT